MTLVEVLLTFCPPGPKERSKTSSSSDALSVVSILFLWIEEDAVVDDDDKVVFAVVREVGDERFARFGKFVAAAAEGALLEDLPTVGRHEVVRFLEGDEVEIVFAGF